MKKIWGHAASGILTDEEGSFHSPRKDARRFERLPVHSLTRSFFSVCISARRMPAALFLTLVVMALTAVSVRAQTNFANALVIGGTSGSVQYTNTGIIPDPNCPPIAGFPANAPVWFSWTAPQSGEVEMDTIGSVSYDLVTDTAIQVTNFVIVTTNNMDVVVTDTIPIVEPIEIPATNNYPLDTALAVFTGNSISSLNQVAANDNMVPINGSTKLGTSESASLTQIIESGSGEYGVVPGGLALYAYKLPFYGPSHLKFNAVAGQTYYIAVDTEADSGYATFFPVLPTGSISLQWAYQSSGVFRFATEDFDPYTLLPLYQAAGTESALPAGTADDANSTILTYYPYNAPGLLVTVTRVGGSSGRCTVDYSTVDGTNLLTMVNGTNLVNAIGPELGTESYFLAARDAAGVQNVDYVPVSGTLVFDDNEMSKTILVPIIDNFLLSSGGISSGGNLQNIYFGIVLSNAQVDPNESADISQPRIDPTFGTAMVRILNPDADPYGPDLVPLITSNTVVNMGVTNTTFFTNLVVALAPTNTLFSFEKAHYRIPEDVNDVAHDGWTQVAIYVERFGTNSAAQSLTYGINRTVEGCAGVEIRIQ